MEIEYIDILTLLATIYFKSVFWFAYVLTDWLFDFINLISCRQQCSLAQLKINQPIKLTELKRLFLGRVTPIQKNINLVSFDCLLICQLENNAAMVYTNMATTGLLYKQFLLKPNHSRFIWKLRWQRFLCSFNI